MFDFLVLIGFFIFIYLLSQAYLLGWVKFHFWTNFTTDFRGLTHYYARESIFHLFLAWGKGAKVTKIFQSTEIALRYNKITEKMRTSFPKSRSYKVWDFI